MRLSYVACLVLLIAQPAFACNVTIGDYTLKQGDIKSTSVVRSTNAQAVLSSDASRKLQEMAKTTTTPVLVKVGSYQAHHPLQNILGLDAAAPKLLENAAITIPGKNTSDGLVMQQVLKTCL